MNKFCIFFITLFYGICAFAITCPPPNKIIVKQFTSGTYFYSYPGFQRAQVSIPYDGSHTVKNFWYAGYTRIDNHSNIGRINCEYVLADGNETNLELKSAYFVYKPENGNWQKTDFWNSICLNGSSVNDCPYKVSLAAQ